MCWVLAVTTLFYFAEQPADVTETTRIANMNRHLSGPVQFLRPTLSYAGFSGMLSFAYFCAYKYGRFPIVN